MKTVIFKISLLCLASLTSPLMAGEIELKREAICDGEIRLGDIAHLKGSAGKLAHKIIPLSGKDVTITRHALIQHLSGEQHRDVNWGTLVLRGSQSCRISWQTATIKPMTLAHQGAGKLTARHLPARSLASPASKKARYMRYTAQAVANQSLSIDTQNIDATNAQPILTDSHESHELPHSFDSTTVASDIQTEMKRQLIARGQISPEKLDAINIKTSHVHQPWLALEYSPSEMQLSLNRHEGNTVYQHVFTLNYEDTNGQIKQVKIPVNHEKLVTTYALSQAMQRGAILSESDLRTVRIPAGKMKGSEIVELDTLLGMTLKRYKRAGETLIKSDIAPQKLVRRGDLVSVYSKQGSVIVKTVGIAQHEGALGDTVTIKNEGSKETFLARITGPQQVTVSIKG